MDSNKNLKESRQIFKATSIFGGVQVIQIFISIVRSKFISVLLGASGMGISGLFFSSQTMITSITSLGLGTSAVREIASAYGLKDEIKLGKVIGVLRILVWLTGALGTLVMLIFAKQLSVWSFGNESQTMAFQWLSISLLISQITAGQSVVIRGFSKIKFLASSSLYGSIIGLVITVPLYYVYGEDGIVPAIILSSVFGLIISTIYSRKIAVKSQKVSFNDFKTHGIPMIQLGIALSISGIIIQISSYLLRIFISDYGSLVDVGLYTAGFTMMTTYFGMIFTAMSTDFYPRLSATVKLDDAFSLITNQAKIGLLIISPLLLIFMVCLKWVIIILYSTEFLPIVSFIQWALIGMLFKVISWPLGFLILSKANTKVFMINEIFFNILMFVLNICFYYFLGLDGLGIAFLVGYFIYFVQISLFSKFKFDFTYCPIIIKIFLLMSFLTAFSLLLSKSDFPGLFILFGQSILVSISLVLSISYLNKELDILNFLKNKLKK